MIRDEGGLSGALHLAPAWMFEGYDAILAADIGGTNIRAGVIEHRFKQASDLSKAAVSRFDTWRYANDKPSRTQAVERLIKMLRKLITRAEKAKIRVAPFIASGVQAILSRTARSIEVRKICREIGKARNSICRIACSKAFRRSADTRLRS
jgi:hypothetical protein